MAVFRSPEARRTLVLDWLASDLTAGALAREVGLSQPTLSRWLREAGTVPTMSDPTPERARKSPA